MFGSGGIAESLRAKQVLPGPDQRQDRQDDEGDHQPLGDAHRQSRHVSGTEQPGDDGENEERNGEFEDRHATVPRCLDPFVPDDVAVRLVALLP